MEPTKLQRVQLGIDPEAPTEHKHGSIDKIELMAERAACGLPLFNPGDKVDLVNPPDRRRSPRYMKTHACGGSEAVRRVSESEPQFSSGGPDFVSQNFLDQARLECEAAARAKSAPFHPQLRNELGE